MTTLTVLAGVSFAGLGLWSVADTLSAATVSDDEFVEIELVTQQLAEVSEELPREILAYDASNDQVADHQSRMESATKKIDRARAVIAGSPALEKSGNLAAAYQSFDLAVARYSGAMQEYQEALTQIYPLAVTTYSALDAPAQSVKELRTAATDAQNELELRPGNVQIRDDFAAVVPKLVWIAERMGESPAAARDTDSSPPQSDDNDNEPGAKSKKQEASGPSQQWLDKRLNQRTRELDADVEAWHEALASSYVSARSHLSMTYKELQKALDDLSGAQT